MADILEALQADCQREIWQMHRRAEALERVRDVATAIRALGYDVEVTAPGGMLELRFDPEQAIAPARGPLEGAGDAGGDTAAGGAVQPKGKAVTTPPPPKPAPLKQAAPAPDPASKPLPGTAPTPPWTDADRDRALDLLVQDHTPAAVAALLGRPTKQVSNLRYLRRDEIAARQAAAKMAQDPGAEPDPGRAEAGAEPADAPPPDPKGAPAPDLVNRTWSAADDMPEGLSAPERAIWRHLAGLPASFWTPSRDLALAEGLARGDGAAGVCEALGVERAELRDRWAQINTKRGDLDHQTALLRVLRLRAGGGDG